MYKVNVNNSVLTVEEKSGEMFIDGEKIQPDILPVGKDKFHILLNNKSYTAEILETDAATKTFSIKVGKNVYKLSVSDQYDELLKQMGIDAGAGKKVNDIKAPMPGMVLNVMVEAGQPIKKGEAIVVLEAMKMENILKSPADGTVKKVFVLKGDKVEKNQVMVHLE